MVNSGHTIKQSLPNIMKWIQVYLVGTILLYLFGPIHYVKYNLALVLVLLAIYQLFLWAGYNKGVNKTIKGLNYNDYRSSEDFNRRDQRLIMTLGVIGIFFDFLMMYRMLILGISLLYIRKLLMV